MQNIYDQSTSSNLIISKPVTLYISFPKFLKIWINFTDEVIKRFSKNIKFEIFEERKF